MVMKIARLDGSIVSEYEVLQVNGYNRPVLVKDKSGEKLAVIVTREDGKEVEGA